jgi:hypothetical protein
MAKRNEKAESMNQQIQFTYFYTKEFSHKRVQGCDYYLGNEDKFKCDFLREA